MQSTTTLNSVYEELFYCITTVSAICVHFLDYEKHHLHFMAEAQATVCVHIHTRFKDYVSC